MTTRPANVPTEPRAFVAWENRRKARYELIGGEVRLMAGGSRAHDVVAGNLLAALHLALRGKDCDVHGSNLKVVSPAGMVTYPDVFVRCGPLADEAIECQDPVVVFEVLSPSTRSEDLVRKRWGYQAIPTLAHLVYVDAARVRHRDRDPRPGRPLVEPVPRPARRDARPGGPGHRAGATRDLRLDPRRRRLTRGAGGVPFEKVPGTAAGNLSLKRSRKASEAFRFQKGVRTVGTFFLACRPA